LGQIVGASDLQAAVYENGGWRGLGFYGAAASINNSGQIAANKWLTDSTSGALYDQAVLIDGGTITEISSLGGKECAAHKINKASQVVGSSVLADGGFPGHAFLYSNGTTYDLNSLLTGGRPRPRSAPRIKRNRAACVRR
jgi:probable HAF family extracellular repeat protein